MKQDRTVDLRAALIASGNLNPAFDHLAARKVLLKSLSKSKSMPEIALSKEQHAKVLALGTGKVIFAYNDKGQIRMETERGRDPYVWRDGDWRAMTF